jgi:hypothetical protein
MEHFSPVEYVKIAVANAFGQDKLTWQSRLAWFDAMNTTGRLDPAEAESPAQAYAALMAYKHHVTETPSGFLMSLDATASGLQILSCLTRDTIAAGLCNVVDAGMRMNAYEAIYNQFCQAGPQGLSNPAAVKQAVMTSLYGSIATPKRLFGEVGYAAFVETMKTKAPLVWELNEALLSLWDPTAIKHSWTLPDGFNVDIDVLITQYERVKFLGVEQLVPTEVIGPKKRGRSLCANMVHSIDGMIIREITQRANMPQAKFVKLLEVLSDPDKHAQAQEARPAVSRLWALYKSSGYLSSTILAHLTPENCGLVGAEEIIRLIQSLPTPYSVLSVHDCFRVSPYHAGRVRQEYNYQLRAIARSNLLEHILEGMLGTRYTLTKGTLNPEEILSTNYALS